MNRAEAVTYALIHASHTVEQQFEEVSAPVGLSGPKWAALSAITAEGQPISLRDLAAKLSCVRSNITQLVDRLEKQGLVRRRI